MPPSINDVVNNWVIAGEVFGELGPSRPPSVKITENPGARDPPPQRTAVADAAPELVQVGHPDAHLAVPLLPVMFQFAGATKVTEVIGKALVAGLVTVTVNAVEFVWPVTRLKLGASVAKAPFCAALTGAARGIRNNTPESASNARIVPELNFVRYAFVRVFILFSENVPLNEYLSKMDDSSISCSICSFRRN